MAHRSRQHGARLSAFALAALLSACGSTVQTPSASLQPLGDGLSSESAVGSAGSSPASGTPSATSTSGDGTAPSAPSAPGPARSQTGQPTAAASQAAQAAGVPGAVSGRGVTATSVYVGVPTAEDLHKVAGTFGVSLDPGSLKADADAFVAELNAHGGLLGRKVVPLYYDVKTTDNQANPQQVAQAVCSYFTEDHKVIAVLNAVGGVDTDNFRACFKKARTPLITLGVGIYAKDHFSKDGPYLFLNGAPAVESFVPAWIDRLQAQGYFRGWNTASGGPAAGVAKVGLMEPNTVFGKKLNDLLKAELTSNGITVASEYAYTDQVASYSSDMAAAQLRFATAGVTHVLNLPPASASLFFFMQSAEQQHYRPVYGFSSFDLPIFFQQNAPAAQLVGAKGIGWFPGEDVDTARDPGATPASRACVAELGRKGVRYVGDSQRVALGAALAICDGVHLLAASARKAGTFAPAALVSGFAALGTSVPLASNFGGQLSAGHPSLPTGARDLEYATACSCFRYVGPVRPF